MPLMPIFSKKAVNHIKIGGLANGSGSETSQFSKKFSEIFEPANQ
jgi:hypothetical protein